MIHIYVSILSTKKYTHTIAHSKVDIHTLIIFLNLNFKLIIPKSSPKV